MSKVLLPCPFCGGEAAERDIKEPVVNGWVGCQKCRCFINWVKAGKSLAIAAWNRRADAVPVMRGEWKMDTDPDDGDCRCSSCKVCIDALHKRNHGLLNALGFKLHTFYKYCPNCGAKMEDKP